MSLARKDKTIRAKPETFASSYWLSMLPKLCDMKTDPMLVFLTIWSVTSRRLFEPAQSPTLWGFDAGGSRFKDVGGITSRSRAEVSLIASGAAIIGISALAL
jgi:hypothetical protein